MTRRTPPQLDNPMPDSPFDIDGATWQPVSRKLIHVRTWIVAVCLGLPTLLGIALAAGVTPWLWIAPALTALALVWALWLIRRQVPAIGYCEIGRASCRETMCSGDG